jgi:hypothetical protein
MKMGDTVRTVASLSDIILAITAMSRYVFSCNASTLEKKVIAFYSYRSGNIITVIASDYYCSEYMIIMRRLTQLCFEITLPASVNKKNFTALEMFP